MKGSANATEKAAQEVETLQRWRADLAALDEEIASRIDEEIELRMELQRRNPGRRTDGVGSPVTELRRKIDQMAKKRELLTRDISAKENLLDRLRSAATLEQDEHERNVTAQAERLAVADLDTSWTTFREHCLAARQAWHEVVEAAQTLDRLPAGEAPVSPFPSDIAAAFRKALCRDRGTAPFTNTPRVVARRIETARTRGNGATDTTGFSRTLADLGDW